MAAATLLPNGENCFQATAGLNGMVGVIGTITGGSGGVSGTYGGVALTGGSGSGATANVTVAGGAVSAVTVLNPGVQYVVGDVLSAASGTIGGVTGFAVPVSSTSINSSLAGGTVAFYNPNTATFKQTWFNADQSASHQNTNPLTLDANGCAIIYGIGSYREVLKDSLGNTVWDQITTDTSANNNTFWAGLAGGTPNAISVTDPGFNGTDGSIIQFIPLSTNTGPTTLNPSGFGAIFIVKDTTTGAVALAGGELVANNPSNVINVVYSASQANFHLLNLVNASAATTPQTLCGAIGLRINNDSSTPNSKLDITADQVTMINAASLTVSRLNVSLILNFTVNGANGLDTGALAPSTWYNIYVIDNGAGTASLGSVSATAPTLPSGYSYKCRLGAVQTDGSSVLFRTIQRGSYTTYNLTALTNTAALPQVTGGIAGALQVFLTAIAPPTATRLSVVLVISDNVGGLVAQISPNGGYGNTGSTAGIAPPCGIASVNGLSIDLLCTLNLETQSIFYTSTTSRANVEAYGWFDKVNAN